MMMAGRFGRTRPRSSLQSRPGSSAGRPESRAESRLGGRPRSSVGDRPASRLQRTDSRLTRQDSTLNERPKTAQDRMRGRIDQLNEARAQKEEEDANEPDVECSTKMKALWLLYSGSFLPKVLTVVGGVVLLFGIVMLVIGFATDAFNSGQTVGPALAALGLIILIIGLLGLKTAYSSQRKVGMEEDVEKGKEKDNSKKEKEVTGDYSDKKANREKVLSFAPAEDSDNGSDSDADTASRPLGKSRLQKKNSLSARSDSEVPVVGVARPRTLPPLQMATKPVGQKKRKKKTPRKDLSATNPEYDYSGNISTVGSDYNYGIRGQTAGQGRKKSYGSDNDGSDNEDWRSNYRSKSFGYE